MLNRLLSTFPFLEVLLRNLYWRNSAIHRIANYFSRKSRRPAASPAETNKSNADAFFEDISRLGIGSGDILIVHSSFGELKKFGLTPSEVIARLLSIIGETGTLVMPAIPIFREAPPAEKRFDSSLFSKPFIYNVKKARIWTGALPQALISTPGSVRSRHPLNSVVAFGAHAKKMVSRELTSKENAPCGEGSTWAYCHEHNAKILMIGVDVVHSLTMIHVAEDLLPEQWPIANWYRKRQFRIIEDDFDEVVEVSERRPEWALFYAERGFSKDLHKAGIIKASLSEDVNLSVIESAQLIDFLNSKKHSGYPYYIPFWLK
ncbi:AAC(3) family N-acetyltransferase [Pseudomonas sp. FSL W5-0203]|uniref:AAC(3) family N-acetyltransferase n=1 Tax=Pseudomonas sp. FSL W5-0203 TaxID=1920491 RepID=UPI000936102B|nr:AAC(3) family N-acetyltransferase [Pseudomonas sp. FSL W5-0203]